MVFRVADRLARDSNPVRIVVGASHAYGTLGAGFDVDLLVVLRFEGKCWQMAKEILKEVRPPFPADLLVRMQEQVRDRMQLGDVFVTEALSRREVLYEAAHR